jgi:dTDP-4-dehydrorhamnose 3,5-epimerase-like enzyme
MELFKHEDDRRVLMELFDGPAFKNCKIIFTKKDCVLGDHYHEKKEDVFLLAKGEATSVQIGDNVWVDIKAPFKWFVPRGELHRFELKGGSILLEASTTPFDPNDELKG